MFIPQIMDHNKSLRLHIRLVCHRSIGDSRRHRYYRLQVRSRDSILLLVTCGDSSDMSYDLVWDAKGLLVRIVKFGRHLYLIKPYIQKIFRTARFLYLWNGSVILINFQARYKKKVSFFFNHQVLTHMTNENCHVPLSW